MRVAFVDSQESCSAERAIHAIAQLKDTGAVLRFEITDEFLDEVAERQEGPVRAFTDGSQVRPGGFGKYDYEEAPQGTRR